MLISHIDIFLSDPILSCPTFWWPSTLIAGTPDFDARPCIGRVTSIPAGSPTLVSQPSGGALEIGLLNTIPGGGRKSTSCNWTTGLWGLRQNAQIKAKNKHSYTFTFTPSISVPLSLLNHNHQGHHQRLTACFAKCHTLLDTHSFVVF